MRPTLVDRKKAWNPKARRIAAAELMAFFYPVHYEIGTALEDVMRSNMLSRQQAASLWLIRSQGAGGTRMRRKDIEANVRRWFEVTNAAVSRSLRGLMRPPLELIEIAEDPKSGREKLISLTPKGIAFLDSVASRATRGLADLIEEVSPELVDSAILYFRDLTSAFQRSKARRRLRLIRSDRQSGKNLKASRPRESE
jgi:DNA-binding MarR family transcriptional regulator